MRLAFCVCSLCSSLSLSSHLSQSQKRLFFRTTASGLVSSRDRRASGGERDAAAGGSGAGGEGGGRFAAPATVDLWRVRGPRPRAVGAAAGTATRPDVEGAAQGGGGPAGRSSMAAIERERRAEETLPLSLAQNKCVSWAVGRHPTLLSRFFFHSLSFFVRNTRHARRACTPPRREESPTHSLFTPTHTHHGLRPGALGVQGQVRREQSSPAVVQRWPQKSIVSRISSPLHTLP